MIPLLPKSSANIDSPRTTDGSPVDGNLHLCSGTHNASSLYDVPSTVLVSWCVTAVLHTASSTRCDVHSTVFVSRCDTAILRTSTLYNVPSIVLVSWCDAAVLRTSTLYDVPSTVLVSWCDACLLYTSPSPRDNPESRMPSSA